MNRRERLLLDILTLKLHEAAREVLGKDYTKLGFGVAHFSLDVTTAPDSIQFNFNVLQVEKANKVEIKNEP